MPPPTIDLTDSPEPEESPARAAASALKSFQPRREKQHSKRDPLNPRLQRGAWDAQWTITKPDLQQSSREGSKSFASPKPGPKASSSPKPAALPSQASPPAVRPFVNGGKPPRTKSGQENLEQRVKDDARDELRDVRRERASLVNEQRGLFGSAGPQSYGGEQRVLTPNGQHVQYEVPTSFKTPRGGGITSGMNGFNGMNGVGGGRGNSGVNGVNGSNRPKPRTTTASPTTALQVQRPSFKSNPNDSKTPQQYRKPVANGTANGTSAPSASPNKKSASSLSVQHADQVAQGARQIGTDPPDFLIHGSPVHTPSRDASKARTLVNGGREGPSSSSKRPTQPPSLETKFAEPKALQQYKDSAPPKNASKPIPQYQSAAPQSEVATVRAIGSGRAHTGSTPAETEGNTVSSFAKQFDSVVTDTDVVGSPRLRENVRPVEVSKQNRNDPPADLEEINPRPTKRQRMVWPESPIASKATPSRKALAPVHDALSETLAQSMVEESSPQPSSVSLSETRPQLAQSAAAGNFTCLRIPGLPKTINSGLSWLTITGTTTQAEPRLHKPRETPISAFPQHGGDSPGPSKRLRLQGPESPAGAQSSLSRRPLASTLKVQSETRAPSITTVAPSRLTSPPGPAQESLAPAVRENSLPPPPPAVADGAIQCVAVSLPEGPASVAPSPRPKKRKTKRMSAAASLALIVDDPMEGPTASAVKNVFATRSYSPLRSNAFSKADATDEVVTPDSISTPKATPSRRTSDKATFSNIHHRATPQKDATMELATASAPRSRPLNSQRKTQGILEARALSRMVIDQRKLPSQDAYLIQVSQYVPSQDTIPPASLKSTAAGPSGAHGTPYTPEEDALIIQLKEVENLTWDVITQRLPGRTYGSIQVRYSSKLKNRALRHNFGASFQQRQLGRLSEIEMDTADESDGARRPRRKRNNEKSALDGYISWTDVKKQRLMPDTQDDEAGPASQQLLQVPERHPQFVGERAYPKSIPGILRHRELGTDSGRGWALPSRAVPMELKEHVFDDVGPRKFFKGTSSDVTCLAWASDGRHFAAGSIAITDEQSMQYNKPNNLLLGDYERSLLVELPEHHLPRPRVEDNGNANGLHSMRQTQDQRLFMTVASVQFSPDGHTLYSAGSDCKVRAYKFREGIDRTICAYELDHPASLDLLTVSNGGLVATACHQNTYGCISVYDGQSKSLSLGPTGEDSQIDRAIFPSALKWGAAAHHSNLLLAGFSIDSIDEERDQAGQTCLWDVAAHGRGIEVNAVTRNVFDVAWNPLASAASQIFAIASTPGTSKVSRKTRSIVQCFAPNQNRAKRVLELECPAFDINDVIYCPYDDNLIAVGATDGKVYLWDQRYVNASNKPLHGLEHDASLSVLDHDRDPEVADTGIRFLSWGATSSRLYSGSSDGVVKIWNPYMASENAHVKDVATFTSAVMSGAFNPDYRELLIGEDQGRINLLSVGYGEKTVRSMDRFDFHPAPTSNDQNQSLPEGQLAARELTSTKQIMFKRMGTLPIRQAVQGDNYSGPFLAPTQREFDEADVALRAARDEQHEAHARAAMAMSHIEEPEAHNATRAANKKVTEAYERIIGLQRRLADAEALEPKAAETQRVFANARKERRTMLKSLQVLGNLSDEEKLKKCRLSCNYLPNHTDDDGEVPDSERSRDRIPTAPWRQKDIDFTDATLIEIFKKDGRTSSRCITCSGPAQKPRAGQLAKCQSCSRRAQGYTASCDMCSSPIRPSTDRLDAASKLCERCSFACFRCGKPILVARNASTITCESCDKTWSVGAVGYELVRDLETLTIGSKGAVRSHETKRRYEDDEHRKEHFGLVAIEHYASKWQ